MESIVKRSIPCNVGKRQKNHPEETRHHSVNICSESIEGVEQQASHMIRFAFSSARVKEDRLKDGKLRRIRLKESRKNMGCTKTKPALERKAEM